VTTVTLLGHYHIRYLQGQFEVVLACRDWLAAHNNRKLFKHSKKKRKDRRDRPMR
jgi:hypothetical protein